ncbi:hypothetical protein BANRA_05196 [Klebsiella pneumoniae]|nr:hypothetical protein BANRA_05196 [Klebsiella pneumoniae]
MNYIATVNTPAHGTISVTYSDIEKNIRARAKKRPSSCPEREAADRQRHHLQPSIHACLRKAYVTTSGFGVFIFPVRSGRFCQSKLIELATQIAVWIKTESGFDFTDQEATAQGVRIADNALKCKNVIYEAGIDSWKVTCREFVKEMHASNRIHILAGK